MMNYKLIFKSGPHLCRNIGISYSVCEDKGCYFIESFIEGGAFYEKVCLGNCKKEKAVFLAKLFAEKGVHPLHIDDIISDMRF